MPTRTRILLIEDELKLLMAMHQWLTERNYLVETASNGSAGLALARKNDYAIIVSDVVMPQLTGLEVLKTLRSEGIQTPIILLTALNDMDDKIEGFEAGADDYLTKPFDFQELFLRIKAIARRPIDTYQFNNILKFDELEMNLDSKDFSRQGKKILLTPREYDLMEYFLRHPNRAISKTEIAEKVWKLDIETGTNVVEVYVNFLRKKVENGFDKKLIHTQFKTGYILGNHAT
jgi:two-component system, OmpR family, copper resistance phosphate regulon response regulator CusR